MHLLQNELRKQEHFHSVTLKLVMPTSWVTRILCGTNYWLLDCQKRRREKLTWYQEDPAICTYGNLG